jgi:hypothetical protein
MVYLNIKTETANHRRARGVDLNIRGPINTYGGGRIRRCAR